MAARRLAAALALLLALAGTGTAGASATATVDPLTAPGVLVARGPAPPVVTATSWVVADLGDGDVLAAQNARLPLAPASTLKLLTALALGPALPDQTLWTATADAAAVDGSKVGTAPGSVYSVGDLMHGLLLGSGNDCAQGLAELSGGMPAATAAMSDLAGDLGATDTVVANTSGLDAAGQVSSARDLALIGRAALADARVAALASTPRYGFPGAGTTFGPERPRFEVGNHNRLLGAYPGAVGLKNGYTDAARGSFVGAANRDGRSFVVAVLHAEGPTWRHAAALLDWAFATPRDQPAVGDLDAAPDPPAAGGSAPQARADDAAGRAAREGRLGDGAVPSPTTTTSSGGAPVAAAARPSAADPTLPGWVPALLAAVGTALAAVVVLRRRR